MESYPQAFLLVLAGLFAIDWVVLLFINLGVKKIDKKELCDLQDGHQNDKHFEMASLTTDEPDFGGMETKATGELPSSSSVTQQLIRTQLSMELLTDEDKTNLN